MKLVFIICCLLLGQWDKLPDYPVQNANEAGNHLSLKEGKKLLRKHGALIAFKEKGKWYFKAANGTKCRLK